MAHPFHHVEQWTNTHFEPSCSRAGVVLHLGHGGCRYPSWVDHAVFGGHDPGKVPHGSATDKEDTWKDAKEDSVD
ncbi:hypothetical protein ID866_8785 [Astraeus odoratus]|nr:hypothetical protein ID866_8785 [Astraeus odoratus]